MDFCDDVPYRGTIWEGLVGIHGIRRGFLHHSRCRMAAASCCKQVQQWRRRLSPKVKQIGRTNFAQYLHDVGFLVKLGNQYAGMEPEQREGIQAEIQSLA